MANARYIYLDRWGTNTRATRARSELRAEALLLLLVPLDLNNILPRLPFVELRRLGVAELEQDPVRVFWICTGRRGEKQHGQMRQKNGAAAAADPERRQRPAPALG